MISNHMTLCQDDEMYRKLKARQSIQNYLNWKRSKSCDIARNNILEKKYNMINIKKKREEYSRWKFAIDADNLEIENCCQNPHIEETNGYQVCRNCGTVNNRVIKKSMKRAFSAKEMEERIINEPVSTIYGPRTKVKVSADGRGNSLSSASKSLFKRLSRIHGSLINCFERNLWQTLPIFNKIVNRLSIPKHVAQETLRIYIFAVKNKVTRGRENITILTGALCVCLRIYDIPIKMDEIIEITQITEKRLHRGYDILVREVLPKLNLRVTNISSERYIDRFHEDLKLSMKCRNIAIKILRMTKNNGFNESGRDPKGIAAACIYLSCKQMGIKIFQNALAKIASTTTVTLRKNLRCLTPYIDKLNIQK